MAQMRQERLFKLTTMAEAIIFDQVTRIELAMLKAPTWKAGILPLGSHLDGRSCRIQTCGLSDPNRTLYQAELNSVMHLSYGSTRITAGYPTSPLGT